MVVKILDLQQAAGLHLKARLHPESSNKESLWMSQPSPCDFFTLLSIGGGGGTGVHHRGACALRCITYLPLPKLDIVYKYHPVELRVGITKGFLQSPHCSLVSLVDWPPSCPAMVSMWMSDTLLKIILPLLIYGMYIYSVNHALMSCNGYFHHCTFFQISVVFIKVQGVYLKLTYNLSWFFPMQTLYLLTSDLLKYVCLHPFSQ